MPCILQLFLVLTLFSASTLAHQTSDAYLSLQLTNSTLNGRLSIALRDLSHVLTLDADADGELSDEEFEKSKPLIRDYAFNRLKLTSDSQVLNPSTPSFDIQQNDTAIYVTLNFDVPIPRHGPDLRIDYTLFNDTDPLHRGMFRLDLTNRTETTVFGPSQPSQRFLLALDAPKQNPFPTFLREGVWHIWIGFDHILFLLALLLPSVLHRKSGEWESAETLRFALGNIIKVVTAFTVAHSITLTLATLGWVQLPGRLIESVIAASVTLAALNNIKPIFPDRTWIIAFTFGLIHGFGFATVLAELNLPANALGLALLAFNLGVELGQLAIVLVFVPIAFAQRQTQFYQRFTLRYASFAIALLSTAWLIERAFDKSFLPF